MTIRKGEPWGAPAPLPDDGVIVVGDHEAGAVTGRARAEGRPLPVIGLLGGDLCRTLGGRGDEGRLRGADAMTFVCDLGVATLDGVEHAFVAHAVAHRGWWRGGARVAMNAAWLTAGPEAWNLGPKAHPSDGLLDITELDVGPTQWRAVRRRLPSGSHVPHPAIRVRRVPDHRWSLERQTPVYLDGVRVGDACELGVRIEPDALTVVV